MRWQKTCEFTHQHYSEILETAKDQGYHFAFFQQSVPSVGDVIYLRHDVDQLPEAALQLARIEHGLGVKATYCFLVRSIHYNLFSDEAAQAVAEIHAMGHQIALHLDTGIYPEEEISNADRLGHLVRKEAGLIEMFFNHKIGVVSFHNPTEAVINKDFQGFISTYQLAFFSRIKYLSDSNMQWQEGCLCQVLGEKRYPRMQILIHPFLWQKEPGNLVERFRWSLDYRLSRMEDQMYRRNRLLRLGQGILRKAQKER